MSGSRFLIDTNIVVDFFKGDRTINRNLSEGEIFISSIVVGELYFGAYASMLAKNRKKRLEEITLFISKYPILEVDEKTSDYYGQIKTQLKLSGKPIPENDIWIAAIAKEHDLPLVTRDNHFGHIEGLETIIW